MSLTDNNFTMPVAPMNYGGNGWGDGIWLILLLLFAFGNGAWGGGGGFDGMYPWLTQNTNQGFDQAATSAALAGINTSVNNGFSNAEVAACNRAMNQMQTDYTNQIATMNQNFANQQALAAQLNGMQAQQASCCCETRSAIKDVAYQVATENCADRAALSDGIRDILAATQNQTQTILDRMCQDKIDSKNEKIVELQNQLSMAQLAASQNAQTAAIIANNEAQTTALEQYLAPVPRPAYLVQNPSCYNPVYGCTA